ncbi:hypothetical protein EXIGLDRAFT_841582 [Exidia glandulosa HHB12029]|uniref:Uncharacterized protein n=1 Tax=Exidia glandulosa HHB12029 TaxID=1314781 RepID=A0A165DSU2_EXIGL|nr:hypothetical protein EXIGLDRAFT_841582 [Exidia glandulosa HHB12029]
MSSSDSFGPNTTLVKFPWPQEITGLERILLSANGGLQRLLSAYFAQQIEAEVVSTSTYYADAHESASDSEKTLPMTQRRVINLVCNGTVVCTATSTIVVNSRDVANLFDQGFFIGQVVRTLQQTPKFTLLDVNVKEIEEAGVTPAAPASDSGDSSDGELSSGASTPSKRKQRLWRRYMLGVDGLECDIEEEFLDREMFTGGSFAL